MSARKTESDYLEMAKKRKIYWIGGKAPKSVNTNTKWQCSQGHQWESTYSSMYTGVRKGGSGDGCPYCSKKARKNSDDYHALAKSKGIKWAGKRIPKTVGHKTKWRCQAGHTWETVYSGLQGCPKCARNSALSEDDFHKAAANIGAVWLGTLCKSKDKTTWMCANGHTWEQQYDHIRNGHGCPSCAGNKRKGIDDYTKLANSLGIKWADKKLPKNTLIKTSWICTCGKKYKATYDTVSRGKGCRSCKTSKSELITSAFLKKRSIAFQREKTFDSCRNINKLPFDFFLEKHNLLIELNGEQHYRPVSLWGGRKKLKETQHTDKMKAEWAAKNGIKLLVIPYTDFDRIEEILSAYI